MIRRWYSQRAIGIVDAVGYRLRSGEILTSPTSGQFENWDADLRRTHSRGLLIVSADGKIAAAGGNTHELLACKTEEDLLRLLGPVLTQLNSLPQAPDIPHRFELHAPGSPQESRIVGFAQRMDGTGFRWLLMLQPAAASPDSDSLMQHAWRSQLLQRLYGTMRHDLNSPIQAALWTFDLLQRAVQQSQLTAEKRAQLEESTTLGRKELARLKSAVHRFLSFAAPDLDAPERLDAGALLEDVQRLIATEASLADVKLVIESPSQPIVIEAVRAPLEQTLVTLLLVALDATAHGGSITTAICETAADIEIAINGGPRQTIPAANGEGSEAAPGGRSSPSADLRAARVIARANGGDMNERPYKDGRAFHLRWPRVGRRPANL